MKKLKFLIGRPTLGCIIALCLTSKLEAQTNLQFTGINATDEGAIQLHWRSQSNELYEIDKADALIDTNTGSITWNKLYDNYPSQGTNTFIGDFGNYNLSPEIVHPKNSPMRFYRVVDQGADSLSDEPSVSISSPSSGNAVSDELTVTVTASTDQPIIAGTKLYVDGQEMRPPDSTTNWTDGVTNYEADTYSLNTCEWGNETHVLFATAQNQSGYSDLPNTPAVFTGHAVSQFVPVLFSNLITRISFSQPEFDPSSGQTQQVSAVFAANCNWTLNIVDVYSNVVQTASSSGTSMLYNWDGTSNGVSIPDGTYYYYIYAQTNGQSSQVVSGGSSGSSGSGSPPSPDMLSSSSFSSDSSELWAMSADGNDAVPLALYPPGFDTNALTIISATPAEVNAARASVTRTSLSSAQFSSTDSGGFSSDASSGGSSAASQGSPTSPQRPPSNPQKGVPGTCGVANDTFTKNGTNGFNTAVLDNGLGIHSYIGMDGYSGTTTLHWGPLATQIPEGNNFISEMKHWGWKNTINKVDDQLSINDLRGSGSPYNTVNLGVFIGHCAYGTSIDYAANGCKQMYIPITSGGGAQFLRMSEMTLGGSNATSGLRWFALECCDSLYQSDWSNMQNLGVKPYNGNLHLLLGTATTSYASANLLSYWAKYMNHGTSTNYSPLTVKAAWYQAAQDAYKNSGIPSSPAVKFATAGDNSCMNDSLQSYTTPGGSWGYNSQQVYP